LPYGIGLTIIFSSCGFFFLPSFLFFPHLISTVGDWMSAIHFHSWCGLSANLGCRSETCCTRLAENAGSKKIAKKAPSAHHCTTLLSCIFATKARIDNRKKNSNISSRWPHNMVNFGLLADEIGPVVWGTLANFNGLRILSALLHGSQVVCVSQTLRR